MTANDTGERGGGAVEASRREAGPVRAARATPAARVLLLSTYEMGRQPFGLASPAAWLREAGCEVTTIDLSRQPLDAAVVRAADVVACHLPMHTATRLAGPVITRVRALNPTAHVCAYGLYAPLTESHLRALGVETILGAEFEADLVALATARWRDAPTAPGCAPESIPIGSTDTAAAGAAAHEVLPRLAFRVPDRRGLPPLTQYARLHVGDAVKTVGYTEATRGCKHVCRHCPIVPVYGGQFRVVPVDVVLADVRQQVAAGAAHVTFGDPDFFNGPRHAMAIVERLAAECPGITYDVTIKIEHLRWHRALLPRLRDTGCLFVTSAVEAVDDRILEKLQKGHTRADFVDAVAVCRAAGLTLVPTFVAFTPWTTVEGYGELLETIRELDLIEQVPSIQLAIRLLIPDGSRLLELEEIRALVGPFDAAALVHPWRHPDPRVDALQEAIARRVGRAPRQERAALFEDIERIARGEREEGRSTSRSIPPAKGRVPPLVRAAVPYLDEPWYC